MFLDLSHTRLPIYSATKSFVYACYKLTLVFPSEERFILTQQMRRAALSIHLNTAEGSSRKSVAERKRFYEIARSSLIEIDAALDIAEAMNYCEKNKLEDFGREMVNCFKQLSGLINNLSLEK